MREQLGPRWRYEIGLDTPERKFIGFPAGNRAAALVKNTSATSPDQDPSREDRVKVTVI